MPEKPQMDDIRIDDIQEKDASGSDASSKKENNIFVSLMIGMCLFIFLIQGLHSTSSTTTTSETTTSSTTSITTTIPDTVFQRFNIDENTPYIVHIVQPGESWASIVDTYGLSKYGFTYIDLAEYNGTHYTQMLYKDNRVSVPLLD